MDTHPIITKQLHWCDDVVKVSRFDSQDRKQTPAVLFSFSLLLLLFPIFFICGQPVCMEFTRATGPVDEHRLCYHRCVSMAREFVDTVRLPLSVYSSRHHIFRKYSSAPFVEKELFCSWLTWHRWPLKHKQQHCNKQQQPNIHQSFFFFN